jgi:hypothetical protein
MKSPLRTEKCRCEASMSETAKTGPEVAVAEAGGASGHRAERDPKVSQGHEVHVRYVYEGKQVEETVRGDKARLLVSLTGLPVKALANTIAVSIDAR